MALFTRTDIEREMVRIVQDAERMDRLKRQAEQDRTHNASQWITPLRLVLFPLGT